jgi:hypothetical protein
MDINRSNYEIWLIDLLEGNLSEKEAEEVTRFLEQNPAIREEFDEMKSPLPELQHDTFKNKKNIRKSTSDIPGSQFELLCVAHLENDIREESKSELYEILDSDPGKRKTFDLINKTKLKPVAIVYKNKSLLFRRTPLQKVIRLAAIGLSSAAAILLLVIIFQSTNHSLNNNTTRSAQIFPAHPGPKEQYLEIPAGSVIRVYNQDELQKEKSPLPVQSYTVELSESASEVEDTDFGEESIKDSQVSPLPPVAVNLKADLGLWKNNSAIMPLNNEVTLQPEVDEMSNVGRFVTKLFREKILREKVPAETPLKGYEIAEAGVTGLNLLFGWEMALNEKNDENGELISVSFSSKILKFNAPVKKTGKQQ